MSSSKRYPEEFKIEAVKQLNKINYICTFNLTFSTIKKIAPLINKIKEAIFLFK